MTTTKEEEKDNERSSGTRSDSDRGSGEGRTDNGSDNGTDTINGDISGGTKSKSGTDGNNVESVGDDGKSTGTKQAVGATDSRTELSNVGTSGEPSGESDVDRKRRLDRERKQRQRAAKRDSDNSRTSNGTGRTRTDDNENETSVLLVEVPEPKKAPKAQGTPKAAKPKVTSAAAKKGRAKAGDIDSSEMSMFIEGVFSLLGSTLGSHWFIIPEESEQISVPLVKMLNKQNKKKKDKVNDLMLPMLLVTAIGSIIVPRLLIQLEEWKVLKNERKQREAQRANSANLGGGTKSRLGSGKANASSERMATEDSPTFGTVEEHRHDVHNANELIPTVPSSLADWSD